MSKPLEGYKIIEFATFVAAPSATRILADMGAEIIKVEGAGGDPYRTNASIYQMPDESDQFDPCFDTTNVNKRFISIDLRTVEGKQIMDRLLSSAHAFVTSTRDKSLKKLGLDWPAVHEKFPRLVYGHLRGYGEFGAMKDEPGFDYTAYFARSGIGGSLYEKGGAPMISGPAFGDLQAGMALAGGILGALVGQANSGEGDRVVVSLHSTGTYVMSMVHAAAQFGKLKYPITRKLPSNPFNNTYQCKDGKWIQLAFPDYSSGYDRVMRAIGREDLVGDSRYSDITSVLANYHREFIEIIEEAIAKKTTAEWVEIFDSYDIANSPLMESDDVLNDPEMWDNEYLSKVVYPTGDEAILFHSPARLDSVGTTPLVPSRGVGSDTEKILSEYGFTEDQIGKFISNKVVFQHE